MKKPSPRLRRSQAQPLHQIVAADGIASGGGKASARAYAIPAAGTKYGPRTSWGPLEYAQAAITALFPIILPKHVNHLKLARDVNDWLARNPDYRASYGEAGKKDAVAEVSPMTVRRAAGVAQGQSLAPHVVFSFGQFEQNKIVIWAVWVI